MTDHGCTPDRILVPAGQQTTLSVLNRSSEAMVFTVPDLENAVTVAPGRRARLSLTTSSAYVWGDYDFFCLSEKAHAALDGPKGSFAFVCSIDSYALRPHALSSGTLVYNRQASGSQP
jgi:hypothetical protein